MREAKGSRKTPLPPAPLPCYPSGYCPIRKKSDPAEGGFRQLRCGNISRIIDTCVTFSRVILHRVILRNPNITLSDSQRGDDAPVKSVNRDGFITVRSEHGDV